MTGRRKWRGWLVMSVLGIAGALVIVDATRTPRAQTVRLHLDLVQDLALAASTDFGEPPQVAVWLEPVSNRPPRTLYVSYRSGSGDWVGKAECPDALPRWFAACREQYDLPGDGLPTPQHPLPDAVTRATAQVPEIAVDAELPLGSAWQLWVEVNLSADYNDTFPRVDANGVDDLHANGQPSLLYSATFTAEPGTTAVPTLKARTVPNALAAETTPDLAGITTASGILSRLAIRLD